MSWFQTDNAGAEVVYLEREREEEDAFQLIGPRDAAIFLYVLVFLCFIADRLGWLV